MVLGSILKRQSSVVLVVAMIVCSLSLAHCGEFMDWEAVNEIGIYWSALGWGTATNESCPADWRGITCSLDGSRILVLDFTASGIDGTIPRAITDLPALQKIWLSSNTIEGTLPAIVEKLLDLVEFHVDANQLHGSLPPQLGKLARLSTLNLASNAFTGMIPSEIGQLSELKVLELKENRLEGTIPADIGLLDLDTFTVQCNSLILCPPLNKTFSECSVDVPELAQCLADWKADKCEITDPKECPPIPFTPIDPPPYSPYSTEPIIPGEPSPEEPAPEEPTPSIVPPHASASNVLMASLALVTFMMVTHL